MSGSRWLREILELRSGVTSLSGTNGVQRRNEGLGHGPVPGVQSDSSDPETELEDQEVRFRSSPRLTPSYKVGKGRQKECDTKRHRRRREEGVRRKSGDLEF